MRSKQRNIFLKSAMAWAMAGLLTLSQWVILEHYRAFHSVETHTQEKKKHNAENCFICHTQATHFILSDFNFKIKEKWESHYPPMFSVKIPSLLKKISYRNSGRAPPFLLV